MTALERNPSQTTVAPWVPATTVAPSADAARLAMETYQEISKALIDPAKDMQDIGRTSFPKRSAFQKLANAYRVSTEIVKDESDYDDDGNLVRCRITVRATHPDGRYQEGDGRCAAAERAGRNGKLDPKGEHDVHGTAVTRAKNRAIADLVAFGAVSAEEVEADGSGGEPVRAELPAWATPVSDVSGVAQSLVSLFKAAGVDKPDKHAMKIGEAMFQDYGSTIPVGVWHAINHIARELRAGLPTADGRVADAMAEGFDEAAAEDAAKVAPVDAEATSEPDAPDMPAE